MKVPACMMLALFMNTAALADRPTDFTGQAYAGDVLGPIDSRQGPHLDTCVQLMKRAFYLADPASFDRAIDARHEMELARDAFHAGDAFACKRHAIHALEDRT
jgi:hypothetical protein